MSNLRELRIGDILVNQLQNQGCITNRCVKLYPLLLLMMYTMVKDDLARIMLTRCEVSVIKTFKCFSCVVTYSRSEKKMEL